MKARFKKRKFKFFHKKFDSKSDAVAKHLVTPRQFMRGQSTVEYILVLGVVISLGIMLLGRSSLFQKYLANNSIFIDGVKNYWEYTYRHGGDPNGRLNSNSVVGQKHDLYQNQEEGASHFFITAKAYP